jgi:hypothetical protein
MAQRPVGLGTFGFGQQIVERATRLLRYREAHVLGPPAVGVQDVAGGI